MTNREKLEEARRLLLEVARDMRGDSHPCQACGLKVHSHWTETQVRDSLRGMAGKLGKLLEPGRSEEMGVALARSA